MTWGACHPSVLIQVPGELGRVPVLGGTANELLSRCQRLTRVYQENEQKKVLISFQKAGCRSEDLHPRYKSVSYV